MGLKKKNNPLGQTIVSDKVGSGLNPSLDPGGSEDLVEQVKRNARRGIKSLQQETLSTPKRTGRAPR